MRYKYTNAVFLIASFSFFALTHAQSSGQNFTLSPFSNFGIGEMLNSNTFQAGANSQTFTGAYSYSLKNPATLANLKYAVFDFGFNGRMGTIESGNEKLDFRGGTFSYGALAFKVMHRNISKIKINPATGEKKRTVKSFSWNSAFSFSPVSSVGFKYLLEKDLPLPTRTAHSGNGGLNAVEWHNGFQIFKHIRLGYSIGYNFGQFSDIATFSIKDSNVLDIEDNRTVFYRGVSQKVGFLYQFKTDSIKHTFGASFSVFNGMNASYTQLTQTIGYNSFGAALYVDTINNINQPYRNFVLPSGWGLGYSVQFKRLLSVALDYRVQNWKKAEMFFQPSQPKFDRSDFGVAITLFPEDEKLSSEKRMKPPIRFGYTQSNTQNSYLANATLKQIKEQSVYFGFGIPITRKYFNNSSIRSIINVNLQALQRGTNANGVALERYLILGIGFNLGDIWFYKRQYE